MSDLPPYLTHTDGRNIPWKGHAAFPRRVMLEQGKYPKRYEDLRIFKLYGPQSDASYELMSEEEVKRYMEDPTHV